MRLIDADALLEKIEDHRGAYEAELFKEVYIDNAQTITPQGDLISRSEAITAIWTSTTRDSATEKIEALPSADAVKVVRCKDCKHKYVSGNGTTQYYVCDFMDAQYEEDGFCHHAESEVEE